MTSEKAVNRVPFVAAKATKVCSICKKMKHLKSFGYGRNICNQCKYLASKSRVLPEVNYYPASYQGGNHA